LVEVEDVFDTEFALGKAQAHRRRLSPFADGAEVVVDAVDIQELLDEG
jgi:hypothetical protein